VKCSARELLASGPAATPLTLSSLPAGLDGGPRPAYSPDAESGSAEQQERHPCPFINPAFQYEAAWSSGARPCSKRFRIQPATDKPSRGLCPPHYGRPSPWISAASIWGGDVGNTPRDRPARRRHARQDYFTDAMRKASRRATVHPARPLLLMPASGPSVAGEFRSSPVDYSTHSARPTRVLMHSIAPAATTHRHPFSSPLAASLF